MTDTRNNKPAPETIGAQALAAAALHADSVAASAETDHPDGVKMDRTAFWAGGMEDAEPSWRYWITRSYEERMQALALLRWMNYGCDDSQHGIQRVLEVIKLE